MFFIFRFLNVELDHGQLLLKEIVVKRKYLNEQIENNMQ